jgi:hypothetical protein
VTTTGNTYGMPSVAIVVIAEKSIVEKSTKVVVAPVIITLLNFFTKQG